MTAFVQDLRYALRQFRRSPGFFGIAVLLIAVAIAANTQIFTLVDALLLRPLPVRDPQNLIQLFEIRPRMPASPYFDYRFSKQLAANTSTLFDIAVKRELVLPLEHAGITERSYVHFVSANFFDELGVRPVLGRLPKDGDDHTAVLSYDYWNRAFNRDPLVLGRILHMNRHAFQIIGVAPERFTGTIVDSSPDVWAPFGNVLDFSSLASPNLDDFVIEIVARSRPGVSLLHAEQEITPLWNRYMDNAAVRQPQYDRDRLRGRLEVRSIADGLSPMRDQFHTALFLLLAGTGLLLLMVCASVGGLLLSRATARERETAVRLAVGASRGRLIQQRLTESLLLTLLGGGAGILLSYASSPALQAWLPPARGIGNDPGEFRALTLDFHPDLRVAGFLFAACLVTALLSAAAPAWRTARHDLRSALKKSLGGARQNRIQSGLCAMQVALCTVLLASAGLFTRSLSNLRSINPGFRYEHVAIFSVDPGLRSYDSQEAWRLQQRVLEGVGALPGVEAAALANRSLLRLVGLGSAIVLPGQRGTGVINTSMNFVSPRYFDVMSMHFLAGRGFRESDQAGEGEVTPVIVNEAFVRRFLGGGNPLGRTFATGKQFIKPGFEVIGVVNDTKYRSFREVPPPIYYQYAFGPKAFPNPFVLHVRTHGDPAALIQPVRRLIRSIDPEVPVFQAATMSEEVDRSLWEERTLAALASSFSFFALLLAASGLYGSLAYFVTGRRREIGLRMALGAEARDVARMAGSRVIPILIAGFAAGGVFSWFAGDWARKLLYDVNTVDAWSASGAVSVLLAASLIAAAVPVWRALRVDPSSSLREE